MLSKLRNWLGGRRTNEEGPLHAPIAKTPPRPAARNTPRQTRDSVAAEDHVSGEIASPGPGKNVPARTRFVREDTGTHETLKIIDDSMFATGEDEGIDPYNTGRFDKSKGWDKRFRK